MKLADLTHKMAEGARRLDPVVDAIVDVVIAIAIVAAFFVWVVIPLAIFFVGACS